MRALIGAAVIAVAVGATGLVNADPASVQGGVPCTGGSNDNYCDGIFCFVFYTEYVAEDNEAEKSSTKGTSTNACVGGTVCGSDTYSPPVAGCE